LKCGLAAAVAEAEDPELLVLIDRVAGAVVVALLELKCFWLVS
jgi:hypothetical protein